MADDHRKSFIKLFNETARYHHRYRVFQDFVMMGSIAIQNSLLRNAALEKDYMDIVGCYEKEDPNRFAMLLGELVMGLEQGYSDFLGSVYMELDLGSKALAQVFSPYHLSRLCSAMLYGDSINSCRDKPFITLADPCCGAGSMPIAFAELMLERGFNPQQKLWISCVDVDPTAAAMCYLQLSLLHIPAEVVVGNSLTMQFNRVMHTPAHILGGWAAKLRFESATQRSTELLTDDDGSSDEGAIIVPKKAIISDPAQLGLFDVVA